MKGMIPMRISKKILACVLAALMAIAMMPFTASAATVEVNDADSFEAAVAAANAGDTIKLTGDIDLTKYPAYGSAGSMHYIDISGLTVDLSDHTITIGGRWSTLFTGTNGKIMNGTCVGTPSPANYQYGLYIWGPGKGDLANSGGASASIVLEDLTLNYGLHCWNANVTVIDCNVTGSNAYYGVWADENSNVTIESGNFTTGGAAVIGCATSSDGQGHINVEGGNFTVPAGKPLVLPASSSSVPENVQISGGTFKNADDSAYAVLAQNIADGATITDGVVTQEYVAKIGDTYYATLTAAISAATAGDTVTLLADTSVNTGSSASSRYAISKSLTIDGGNHTVSINNRGFGVGMNASSNIDVTFKNITITNPTNAGRCVDTRGNLNSLTLDNATLETTGKSGYLQPLTIGGNQASTATVTVKDSVIKTSDDGSKGYAIITFNPVAMNITGSTIKGWACIYAKGVDGSAGSAGSTFTATGSNFVSKNTNSGLTNAFGTLVVEDSDIDFDITNCNISIDGEANHQYLFTNNVEYLRQYVDPNAEIEDVTVALGEGNNVDLKAMGDFTVDATDDVKLEISGGYFSKVVPAECCADGYAAIATPDASGKYTVGKPNDGANITVADEISQNFYIDEDFYGENAYVAVTYNTNTNVEESATIGTEITRMGDLPVLSTSGDYDGNRIISITQAPAQVTENVEINVYASQADAQAGTIAVNTLTYRTYYYCKTILETPNAVLGAMATELKELAKTTLDYAAAAQTYFNYNTDNMATADNAGNDFYNDVQDTEFVNVSAPNFGGLFTSLTVVVKSDLEINLLTKTNFSFNSYNYSPTKGGSRFGVSTHVNGDYKVLHIAGIEPANMDENITVYTSNGNVDITANAIMKILSRTGNANLATLAKAMYRYGQAAEAYFAD
jgi:hypothetical protein